MMGMLTFLANIGRKPVTFFEHEGVETANRAKAILEQNGVKASNVDSVSTKDLGMLHAIYVSDYDKALKILREVDLL